VGREGHDVEIRELTPRATSRGMNASSRRAHPAAIVTEARERPPRSSSRGRQAVEHPPSEDSGNHRSLRAEGFALALDKINEMAATRTSADDHSSVPRALKGAGRLAVDEVDHPERVRPASSRRLAALRAARRDGEKKAPR